MEQEALGSKEKFWYRETDEAPRWLFQFPRLVRQHWAEKIAAEIAESVFAPCGGFPELGGSDLPTSRDQAPALNFLSFFASLRVYQPQMTRPPKISKAAAMRAAKNVAAFLRSLGARRVILFGSLVSGPYLPGSSDIDLFFDGVPSSKETLVAGKTLLEFPELPLELRCAGFCDEEFRTHVFEYGSPI